MGQSGSPTNERSFSLWVAKPFVGRSVPIFVPFLKIKTHTYTQTNANPAEACPSICPYCPQKQRQLLVHIYTSSTTKTIIIYVDQHYEPASLKDDGTSLEVWCIMLAACCTHNILGGVHVHFVRAVDVYVFNTCSVVWRGFGTLCTCITSLPADCTY